MTIPSANAQDNTTRQRWMRVLAQAPTETLEEACANLGTPATYSVLRAPDSIWAK